MMRLPIYSTLIFGRGLTLSSTLHVEENNFEFSLLAEMYPDGVPPPQRCSRKSLKAKLLERDPELGSDLHGDTLKKAIDTHNATKATPINPSRTVSD
jgi:hypothetical protein